MRIKRSVAAVAVALFTVSGLVAVSAPAQAKTNFCTVQNLSQAVDSTHSLRLQRLKANSTSLQSLVTGQTTVKRLIFSQRLSASRSTATTLKDLLHTKSKQSRQLLLQSSQMLLISESQFFQMH
jgi:hypothetical protein